MTPDDEIEVRNIIDSALAWEIDEQWSAKVVESLRAMDRPTLLRALGMAEAPGYVVKGPLSEIEGATVWIALDQSGGREKG